MEVKLSAVIITFNEERNIERCITSLDNIADEILVVDSFSTDRTETICREKGVKFLKNKFEGHVEQKNFALQQAKYDHVISLDADEALSDELKLSVLRVKENWRKDAYRMNRLTNYCGQWIRHCGWYPDVKLRLCDRRKCKWEGMNPHDRLTAKPGSSIGRLEGDILHYSFYTIQEHKKQVNYFSEVAARALYDKGIRSNWLKILIKPFAQFVKGYIIKAGFLDGKYGFIICRLSAYAKYLRYRKLYYMQKTG